MFFHTLNSTYHIDEQRMTWSRDRTETSGPLLAESGPLAQLPEIVIGQRCTLVEGPDGVHEIIHTSRVVSVCDCG